MVFVVFYCSSAAEEFAVLKDFHQGGAAAAAGKNEVKETRSSSAQKIDVSF